MSNIEKKLRKRGMQKLDKFAKNPYKMQKAPSIKRVPAWFKITVPAVSCALALSIAVIIMLPNFAPKGAKASHNKGVENQEPADASNGKAASEAAVSSTPTMMGGDDWKYLSFAKQYSKVIYDNKEYEAMETYPKSYRYASVAMDDIESYIGSIHVSRTYDGVLHEQDVNVYKVKNISSDAFICINNYVYANWNNTFTDLGDFLNQYSFDTEVNLRYTTISMSLVGESTTYRESASKDAIKSYIFNDTTVANDSENILTTDYVTAPCIRVVTSIPVVGLEIFDLEVYSSGVLQINNNKNLFNIGVTAYQGLYDYIISLVSQFSIIIYK